MIISDVNSESVEDQEEDLAFFCGICDERITADSDVYDIHIQGNCPEKVDDNETESLTVVPVKFEGNFSKQNYFLYVTNHY